MPLHRLDDEELYDEPDKLMQYLWRTNSVSTVSEECVRTHGGKWVGDNERERGY